METPFCLHCGIPINHFEKAFVIEKEGEIKYLLCKECKEKSDPKQMFLH